MDASSSESDEVYEGQLHRAVHKMNLSKLEELVEEGADVNTVFNGETPLHYAAKAGSPYAAEVLLDAGANVNAVDAARQTPLYWAAEMGENTVVQVLLDAGAKVDARDNDGQTPLHWAVVADQLETAQVLLAAGANLEERDGNGQTPLQAAGAGPGSDLATHLQSKDDNEEDAIEGITDEEGEQFSLLDLGEECMPVRVTEHSHFIRDTRHSPLDFMGAIPDTDQRILPLDEQLPQDGPTNGMISISRLITGAVIADKYRIDSRFITGKGYIRTAVDILAGEPITLKFYEDKNLLQEGLDQCNLLKNLSCVCKLVDKLDSHDGLPACLVLERGEYTLDTWLESSDITEESKLETLKSLATILAEFHGTEMVHCDTNPSSFGFFSATQKWKILNPDTTTKKTNTTRLSSPSDFAYASPEVLNCAGKTFGEYDKFVYSPAADMWAFGVIAYEMLTGEEFCENTSRSPEDVKRFLQSSKFTRKLNSIRNKKHRHFIKKFLKEKPRERQTAEAAVTSSLFRTTTQTAAPPEGDDHNLLSGQ